MEKESLYIKFLDSDGEEVLFPEGKEPVIITEYEYTADRMGSAPTITAEVKYPECLDSLWTRKEYVEFNGEKFYVSQVPSSSKDNEDVRYTHSITFTSERVILEQIYAYDVVTMDDDEADDSATKYHSNTTSFSFYGDIKEFVGRMNGSLAESGVYGATDDAGFHIEIDDGVETDSLEVSFEDLKMSEALQEIYNVYGLTYYWVGKTCHVGDCQNVIGEPFEYGRGNPLLSIEKENANTETVTRVTGYGGETNIQYYYPNDSSVGNALFDAYENGSKLSDTDGISVSLSSILKYLTEYTGETWTLHRCAEVPYVDLTSYDGVPIFNGDKERIDSNFQEFELESVASSVTQSVTKTFYIRVGGTLGGYFDFSDLKAVLTVDNDEAGEMDVVCAVVETSAGTGVPTFDDKDTLSEDTYYCTYVNYQWIRVICSYSKAGVNTSGNTVSAKVTLSGGPYYYAASGQLTGEYFEYGDDGDTVAYSKSGITDDNIEERQAVERSYTFDDDSGYGNFWWVCEDTENDGAFRVTVTGREWMTATGHLMPSIYRDSGGEDRFYSALNDTYPLNPEDESEGYYEYPNEYEEGDPHESIQTDEDIYPTIVGVTNSSGELIAEVVEFAYDEDDSDATTEGSDEDDPEYIHPYFYAKLHIFDGDSAFNLFECASSSEEAYLTLTCGNLSACSFEIAVEKEENEDGTAYNFYNPVLTDDDGNLKKQTLYEPGDEGYFGDYILGLEHSSYYADRQQDTSSNEVWIALKKDNETFGVVMPNVLNNYKPTAGDSFVLTGIALPESYILAAEHRLDEFLLEYMAENNEETFNYTITFSRVWIATHPDLAAQINENTLLTVRYNGVDHLLYVSSYSCKADDNILYEITVGLSEELTLNQSTLRSSVEGLTSSVTDIIGSLSSGTGTVSIDIDDLKDDFLSSTEDDTAEGHITFEQGLTSEDDVTVTGDLTVKADSEGERGNITADGNIEAGGDMVAGGDVRSENFNEDEQTGFGIIRNTAGNYSAYFTNLNIWGKATFQQLEIRELYSVGGTVILSPASSVIFQTEEYYVDGEMVGWKCWYLADDNTTATQNGWQAGDQARCQSFDIKEGAYEDVGNKDYWRCVIAVSDKNEHLYDDNGNILYDKQKYGWVVLSLTNAQPSDYGSTYEGASQVGEDYLSIPAAGDTIVVMGHQPQDDDSSDETYRMNVMILSSSTDDSPEILMYHNVYTFSLDDALVGKISPAKTILNSSTLTWLSSDGQEVPQYTFMGEWAEGNSVATQYTLWSYDGEMWRYDGEESTAESPSSDVEGWVRLTYTTDVTVEATDAVFARLTGEEQKLYVAVDIYEEGSLVYRGADLDVTVYTDDGTEVAEGSDIFDGVAYSGYVVDDSEDSATHSADLVLTVSAEAEEMWNQTFCIIVTYNDTEYRQTVTLSLLDVDTDQNVILDLDNEVSVVPAMSDGTVAEGYQFETTEAHLWQGTEDIREQAAWETQADGCEYTFEDYIVTPLSMDADTASITIEATYGGVTYATQYRLTKAYGTVTVYSLQLGAAAIHTDTGGTLTPSVLQMAVKKTTGETSSTIETWDALEAEGLYIYIGGALLSEYDAANYASLGCATDGVASSLSIRLLDSDGTEHDHETLYVVSDGEQGEQGEDGVTVTLTPDSITTKKTGEIVGYVDVWDGTEHIDFDSSGAEDILYDNSDEVAYDDGETAAWQSSNIKVTVSADGGEAMEEGNWLTDTLYFESFGYSSLYSGTLTFRLTQATEDDGVDITVYIEYDGVTYTRQANIKTVTDGEDGATGVGVSGITEYYLVTDKSTGVTVSDEGWSEEIGEMTAEKPYLWNYEVTQYTDGTEDSTEPHLAGMLTEDGVGIASVTNYYATSTSSEEVTGEWSTTCPELDAVDRYLWNYEIITYTDGTTSSTEAHVVGVYGDTGTGIRSAVITYVISQELECPSDDVFDSEGTDDVTELSIAIGDYLWIRTVTTYTDGTAATVYNVSRVGSDGAAGADGESSYVHFAYATSEDGSEGFSTTAFDGATYIGVYTDGESADSEDYADYTWSRLRGEDGVGIASVTTTYGESSSAAEEPGEWYGSVTELPLTQGDYIWLRAVTTYTDGTESVAYTLSMLGKDGDTGLQGAAGADGESSYVHFAYATSEDGSEGFSTTAFDGATYIGVCTTADAADPTDYTAYTWSLFKGTDGEDGISVNVSPSSCTLHGTGAVTLYVDVYKGTELVDAYGEDSEDILYDSSDEVAFDDGETAAWTTANANVTAAANGGDAMEAGNTLTDGLFFASAEDGGDGHTFLLTLTLTAITDGIDLDIYVTYGGETYVRGARLVSVTDGEDGSDGENSVRIDLSNEMEAVLADTLGNVQEEIAGTAATLYDGKDDVTAEASWTAAGDGITAEIGQDGNVTVSGMTEERATVTIQAVYGGQTYLTYYKLYKTVSVKYTLMLDATAVKVSADGTVSPASVTAKVWRVTGGGSEDISGAALPSDYGLLLCYGVNDAAGYTAASATGSLTVQADGDYASIDFYLLDYSKTDGTNITTDMVLDVETVPVVADGKGVSSYTTYYIVTEDASEVPDEADFLASGVTSVTELGDISQGDYIWVMVYTVYTDGTTSTAITFSHIGEDGEDGEAGEAGEDGKTSYTHIAYATSEDGSEGFSTTAFDGALYIGFYTDFEEEDSEDYTSYEWARLRGEDGVGLTVINEYYLVTSEDSGVTVEDDGWSGEAGETTAEKPYLWNYEEVVYSDGTTTVTAPHIVGMYTEDGVGIAGTVDYYLVSESQTSVPDTSVDADAEAGQYETWYEDVADCPDLTPDHKYLWNYEVTAYTDGTTYTTDPHVIGVYGDTGEDGEDGEDGVTVTLTPDSVTTKTTGEVLTYVDVWDGAEHVDFDDTAGEDILYDSSDEVAFDDGTVAAWQSSNIKIAVAADGGEAMEEGSWLTDTLYFESFGYSSLYSGTLTFRLTADTADEGIDITVYIEYGGVTYARQANIKTVTDGEDGVSSIRLDLSNEVEPVLYNEAGVLMEDSIAGTKATLYDGTDDVTSSATLTVTAEGVTAEIDTGGNVTVADMTEDKAEVTVTAAYQGATRTATYSLYKTYSAKYSLVLSTSAVSIAEDGTVSPDAVTARILMVTGAGEDGSEWLGEDIYDEHGITLAYSQDGSETITGVTADGYITLDASEAIGSLTFYILKGLAVAGADIGTYTVLDMETVPFVSDGSDGTGLDGIQEFYLVTSESSGVTTSTDGWSTEIGEMTAEKPYLWNYEIASYSDGTATLTTPHIVGYYTEDGVSVTGVVNYYAATSSSTTYPDDGDWQEGCPTLTATLKYLWNYEVTTYSDGSTTETDPHVIGVYGDTGEDGEDGEDAVDVELTPDSLVVKGTGKIATFVDIYVGTEHVKPLEDTTSETVLFDSGAAAAFDDGTDVAWEVLASDFEVTVAVEGGSPVDAGEWVTDTLRFAGIETSSLYSAQLNLVLSEETDEEGISLVVYITYGGVTYTRALTVTSVQDGADGADGLDGSDGDAGPTYYVQPVSIEENYESTDSLVYSETISSTITVTDSSGVSQSIRSAEVTDDVNCSASTSGTSGGTWILNIKVSSRTVETTIDGTDYSESVSYTSGSVDLVITLANGDTVYHTVTWTLDISQVLGTVDLSNTQLLITYESVSATVDDLSDNVTSLQSSVSEIEQTAEEISSTVSEYTATVDDLSGDVTSLQGSVSEIEQTAEEISLTVQNITYDLRTNLVWDSYLTRVSKTSGSINRTVYLEEGETYTLTANGRITSAFKSAYSSGSLCLCVSGHTSGDYASYIFLSSTSDETVSTSFEAKGTGEYSILARPSSSSTSYSSISTRIYYSVLNWVHVQEGDAYEGYTLAEGEEEVKDNLLEDTLEDMMQSSSTYTIEMCGDEDCYSLSDGVTLPTLHAEMDAPDESTSLTLVKATLAKGTIENNQEYTLSFYAKTDGAARLTATLLDSDGDTLLQGGVGAGGGLIFYTDSASETGNGSNSFLVTASWARYVIRWTTYTSGADGENNLRVILYNTDLEDMSVYIAGVKLEKGGRATDLYSSTTVLSGLLATGIDIAARTITLTADQTYFQDTSGTQLLAVTDSGISGNIISKFSTQYTTSVGSGTVILSDEEGNTSSTPSKTLVYVKASGSFALSATSDDVGKMVAFGTASGTDSSGIQITYATDFDQDGTNSTATVGVGGGGGLLMACFLKSGNADSGTFGAGWCVIGRYITS